MWTLLAPTLALFCSLQEKGMLCHQQQIGHIVEYQQSLVNYIVHTLLRICIYGVKAPSANHLAANLMRFILLPID